MPEVSPSVLIIRLDAIGDALALAPAIAALRDRDIPVDVVLRQANAQAFAGNAVRETFGAAFGLRNESPANLAAIESFGRELAIRDYTHVLVATEDPGGYRLAAAVGAPVRIGFEDWRSKPLKALWTRKLLTKNVYRSAKLTVQTPHECEALFSLVAPLVGPTELPSRDPARLRPLVLDAEPPLDDRIAVQITDKWERLGIAFESVVELVRRLDASGTLHLLAARREAEYAGRIAEATALSVTYFDDLAPWKAAVAAARALVAPDSGAIHVAGMTGTPVVAVFPPMPLYDAWIARWAPWAAPHRIVRADDGWPARAFDALAQLL